MLKELSFTNFKSWPQVKLTCGRITGIFGTNSSGKTSILQFLLLMKQTKDATDRKTSLALNGDIVQLGTIKDAIHKHDETKSITLKSVFELDTDLALNDPSRGKSSTIARGRNLTVSAELAIQQSTLVTRRLAYELGGRIFELSLKSGGQTTKFALTTRVHNGENNNTFNFVRNPGRVWALPGPIKTHAFPDQTRTYFQNAGFLADLEAAYEAQIDNIYYLGPLREFPKRDYLWARSRPTDVGQRGEKTVDAILAATEAHETRRLKPRARSLPFQEMLAYCLREMGLIESFAVTEIAKNSNRWQARLTTRPGASEVLLTDVGFGVSQVLPVITLLQYVPEGSTVLLEQPEIHLHPLAQANLADLIIQAAMYRRIHVLLESHSEHLLLRLQRRIAEASIISSDDVKLYFCNAPNGVSTLMPLDIDLLGNIRNWPDKFMGDAISETIEAEHARLKRMS